MPLTILKAELQVALKQTTLGPVQDALAAAAEEADRVIALAEQALANLLVALRYGRGTISLTSRLGGGRVELHVTDEGPGFPPEFLADVWLPLPASNGPAPDGREPAVGHASAA
jgi:C4-dicarboxylate-specific signal transduction histidine kinase